MHVTVEHHSKMGDADESHPLYGIFSTLDVDGDGYLSRDDLTEALATIGLGISVDEIFEKLDPKDSGIIDFDQFIDGASLFTGAPGDADDDDDEDDDVPDHMDDGSENMRSIFRLVDTDGDGVISSDQLGDAVSHVIGRVLASSELQQLKMAFGGDGAQISMETFTSVMQQFTGMGGDDDSDDYDESGDGTDEFDAGGGASGADRDQRGMGGRKQSRVNFSTDDDFLVGGLDAEGVADLLAESKSIKKKNKDLSYKYELLKRQGLEDADRIEEMQAAARVLREQLKQETRRADAMRDAQNESDLEVKQLQRKIKGLQEDQERADEARQKLSNDLAAARAKEQAARERASEAEQATSTREDKLSKSLRSTQLKLEALQTETDALRQGGDDALQQLAEMQARLAAAEEVIRERDEALLHSKAEHELLASNNESLQALSLIHI